MALVEARPALHDALESLHKASQTPAKQRTVKVSEVVDVVCRHAIEDGLDADALRDVVQLASVKTHLDQTSVTTLLKNLYPAQRVPVDVAITVVGALGQGKGKPSPGTQDSLVKWLTTIHEIIEDPNVLSRLYGVLFGMLDMISIRKHVKPFRIQQILELSRGLGNEPALQGLLRVFKDYYPDIILGSTSISRRSFAPQTDAEWRLRISAILDTSAAADETATNRYNGFKVLRKGRKRSTVLAIPDVHTHYANEASVTLEGIDTAEDFVDKLDRIEPPGQLISYLTDPLLQKFVELRPSPITSTRINLWLSTCLEDVYQAEHLGTGDPVYLTEILEGLYLHTQYTKELHYTTLAFLKAYISIWNGRDNMETVLGLLSRIQIDDFDEAYATYFRPMEQVLVTSQGPSAYEMIINFYTSRLQHEVCLATSKTTRRNSANDRIFHDITTHVSKLTTSLLVSLPPGTGQRLISSILSFYELLSTSSKPHVVPIILPPMHLVYHQAQQAAPTTFSRICGIIGSYKLAFDQHPKPVKDYYATDVTDSLNWCLRDLYHLVWISRALITADQKAVGLYCDPALRSILNDYLSSIDREYTIGTAFGLSNSTWLASMSAAAWRTVEEREINKENFDRNNIRYHQGPVSQRSLEVLKRKGGVGVDWDGANGYKVFVLDWLAERGLGGVRELMFATVTELRNKA